MPYKPFTLMSADNTNVSNQRLPIEEQINYAHNLPSQEDIRRMRLQEDIARNTQPVIQMPGTAMNKQDAQRFAIAKTLKQQAVQEKQDRENEKLFNSAMSLVPGYLIGEGVNTATKELSNGKYNSWGDMLNKVAYIDPTIGDLTNPGYYSGLIAKGVSNGVKSLAKYGYEKAGQTLGNPAWMNQHGVPVANFITEAERLGIPKMDRNNKHIQEGLKDYQDFLDKGGYQRKLYIKPAIEGLDNDKERIMFNLADDFGWFLNPPEGYEPYKKVLPYSSNKTYKLYPSKYPDIRTDIVSTPKGEALGTWLNIPSTINNPKGYGHGYVASGIGNFQDAGLIPPRADAFGDMVISGRPKLSKEEFDQLSETINPRLVKNFSDVVRKVAAPGSYLTGDAGRFPIGANYFSLKRKDISSNLYPLKLDPITEDKIINRNGLSQDSYISILSLARKYPETYTLRYGSPFKKWNNMGRRNTKLYFPNENGINNFNGPLKKFNADGSINQQALDYAKNFNETVSKYGGNPGYFDNEGYFNIPHPFLFVKRKGGIMNKIKI